MPRAAEVKQKQKQKPSAVVENLRPVEGARTQVEVFPTFVLLRQGAPFLLQLLPVPLDVLHHQILPRQLIVVWEMVDDLVVREPIASFHTENIADGLHAHPGKEAQRDVRDDSSEGVRVDPQQPWMCVQCRYRTRPRRDWPTLCLDQLHSHSLAQMAQSRCLVSAY